LVQKSGKPVPLSDRYYKTAKKITHNVVWADGRKSSRVEIFVLLKPGKLQACNLCNFLIEWIRGSWVDHPQWWKKTFEQNPPPIKKRNFSKNQKLMQLIR
jgi:hypothetical protein